MIEQWMKLDSYNLYDKMVLNDFRFSIKQMKTEFNQQNL